MDQEIKDFFGTSEVEDLDTMFYNFILQESKEPTPIRLIKKYDHSLSPKIKEMLIRYITTCLNEDLDETCGDPTLLVEPLTVDNVFYHKLIDVLEIISADPDCKPLFVYLIYYLSYLISKQKIKKDNLKYYAVLKTLCSFKPIKKIFEDKKMWGLVDLPDHETVDQSVIERLIKTRKRESVLHDLKKNVFDKTVSKDSEIYEDVREYLEIFKFRNKFWPYEAYRQKTLLPCFLEGALVPYFYNREKYCDMLYNRSVADIRNSLDLFIGDVKYIQKSLHSLIFHLIKDNEKIRNNFVDFTCKFYSKNVERKKLMFERENYITDGVAFNFCNLLDSFCYKIVSKKMLNKIDFGYINRILSIQDEKDISKSDSGKEDIHKIGPEYNAFCTVMLTYRVLFTEISYIKMYDEKRMITEQIDRYEDEVIKKALESKLNVLRTVFFSDFFFQQDTFFEYMVDCIIYKDKMDDDNAPLFFNPMFYRIVIDFKHHNMICRVGSISRNVYLVMQKMLFSDINIHEKENIIIVMYEEKWEISEKLFLKLCEIYAQAGKLSTLDRFTIRGYINLIIQDDHNRYIKLLKKNGINFVSGAIQDLEKLLSFGIDAIFNIKKLDLAINNLKIKDALYKEKEEYKKMAEKLDDYEKQAKGAFTHIDKAFEIVHYILTQNITLFSYNEVRFLLVNTLNYNLKMLVGPKCSSLSVENMRKYNFRPREILGLLCKIYSEARTPDLREAIVNGKDFNLHYFKRAQNIIKDRDILNSNEMCKFDNFVKHIEKLSDQKEEQVEKTYPDEFLDPLTFEVMRNPVKLLTSNVTIDKSTFDLIMVSDGVDPFCREPLDESKYILNDELKKRIEEFERE